MINSISLANFLTIQKVLPNKDDSWIILAIKITGLIVTLPLAFIIDLVKIIIDKPQIKKLDATSVNVNKI